MKLILVILGVLVASAAHAQNAPWSLQPSGDQSLHCVTPPFSSVWQIARGMVSAFKTPHTSLPRPPFGGFRLKQHRPHRTRRTARHGLRREAAFRRHGNNFTICKIGLSGPFRAGVDP
jgi:hypothetical protein